MTGHTHSILTGLVTKSAPVYFGLTPFPIVSVPLAHGWCHLHDSGLFSDVCQYATGLCLEYTKCRGCQVPDYGFKYTLFTLRFSRLSGTQLDQTVVGLCRSCHYTVHTWHFWQGVNTCLFVWLFTHNKNNTQSNKQGSLSFGPSLSCTLLFLRDSYLVWREDKGR